MQRQSEPVHQQSDPPERFPGLRLRAAHRYEIVDNRTRIPSWLHRATQLRSNLFRSMLASNGEITPPCGVAASVSLTVPSFITPASNHCRINFKTLRSEMRSFTSFINSSF